MPKEMNELPNVTIVGRNDGRGKGILWDHLTIRSLVNCETYVAYNDAMQTDKVCQERVEMNDSFVQHSHFLESGDYGKGLLVIAGRSRKIREAHQPAHQARLNFEQDIIKDALESKRPILAICGGSWSLWEALGGGYQLVKVNGHDIVDLQPDDDIFLEDDGRVHSNVQLHTVLVDPDSTLSKVMGGGTPLKIATNSIHQYVVNEKNKPRNVKISARTIGPLTENPNISLDTVEAFETDDEDNVIGVQFHPEAYQPEDPSYDKMKRLFQTMVEKGKIFDEQAVLRHRFFGKQVPDKVEERDTFAEDRLCSSP